MAKNKTPITVTIDTDIYNDLIAKGDKLSTTVNEVLKLGLEQASNENERGMSKEQLIDLYTVRSFKYLKKALVMKQELKDKTKEFV